MNNDNNGILLKLVYGDEYFERLGLDQIDIVKIDVEGFEKEVLYGLKKLLSQNKILIQIEIFKKNFNKINEILNKHKFKLINQIKNSNDFYYTNN